MQAYLRDDIFEDELEETSRNKEKEKSDKETHQLRKGIVIYMMKNKLLELIGTLAYPLDSGLEHACKIAVTDPFKNELEASEFNERFQNIVKKNQDEIKKDIEK